MGVLFIFILFSLFVASAMLFFNKGEKSQEIKKILMDIYENLKELFSNLKKLFLIIKELIQSKLDQGPIQLKDESISDNASIIDPSNESLSSKELNPPSIDSKTETPSSNELGSPSADLTSGDNTRNMQ